MDEPTRLIVLRHGRTAWNAGGRIQGQLDVPLDAHGRWQAARLAAALAGEPIDAVYSSDLQRAVETAVPLADAAGLALSVDTGLRERGFGRFEGLTHAEVAERWPDEAERWRSREPAHEPGGGESLLAFQARALAAAARIAAGHRGQAVALVAHGGVLDLLYRAATGQSLQAPRSWPLGNARINRLLHAGEGFVLVGWDDARHLDDEAGAPA
jgi:probable phosphoglycerate mutase